MGIPIKALGGGFKLKGAISLDSYVDFGKKKRRKAVESRSLRKSLGVPLPAPLADGRMMNGPHPHFKKDPSFGGHQRPVGKRTTYNNWP